MKKIIVLFLLFASCNAEREPMDAWEKSIADYLKAEYIEMTHIKRSSTINGGAAEVEDYVELEVYNSKEIEDINFNDVLLSSKCDELRDSVLLNPFVKQFPEAKEIRIKLIKSIGFFIFKSDKAQTVTYNAH
ncbi:MAG: hypothetical protein ABI772_12400 [Bacteroidota bacterium]